MTDEKIRITPDHLDVGQVKPTKKSLIAKINRVNFFHMYPQAKMILHLEMFPLFNQAVNNSSTRGMIYFLYGDFNTGKSYLLEFMKELIQYKNQDLWKPSRHPIIKLDLSDEISNAMEFYLYLLAHLESPIDANRIRNWKTTKSVVINLRKRLIATLERFQTRIFVLDECQRILDAKPRNVPNIFEAIKDLTNKDYWSGDLRTQFVVCGTNQAYGILEAANWIQGRTYTLQLEGLTKKEYSEFLRKIYRDYVTLGISDKWSLLSPDTHGIMTLDLKIAKYLFKKTEGKVGLTVQIIKKALVNALNCHRDFPLMEDYQAVIVLDKNIMVNHNSSLIKKKIQKKMVIRYQDERCKIKSCTEFNVCFEHHADLLNHYRTVHPEYKLMNADGREIR